MLAVELPLVGEFGEGDHPVGDRITRGLVSGHREQDDEEPELVVGKLVPFDVGLDQLGDQVVPGVRRAVGGHLHAVHDQLDRGADRVVAGEFRIEIAHHLVGPVEDFLALILGHTHQAGDGLQGKLARHLLDEVTRTVLCRGPDDRVGTLAKVFAQRLDRTRREGPRDDLAQVGVMGGVHVEQHESPTFDLLGDRSFPVPRQRGLLQAGEDVAAPGYLLDVAVLGDHPVPAVIEASDAVGLFVPPDRLGRAQLR